jgi:hypothetical protein
MKTLRDWATPITAGAFILSAVTGVLMFFHWDIGLNKKAHEWLSWALLAGVGLHLGTNLIGVKRHLKGRLGQSLIGVFLLVLALSFVPWGGPDKPPSWSHAVGALSRMPIKALSDVARMSPQDMLDKLTRSGIEARSEDQSIQDLVGNNPRKQVQALNILLLPK